MKIYALYKGETLLSTGTMWEIAEDMGVSIKTIRHYSFPAYRRKLEKRGNPFNVRTLVCLGDESELD